jgi:hypothetical protein
MEPVGQGRASRKLLCPFEDDAAVALGDNTGVERRVGLEMGRLRAVDLRRHDRVAEIEMPVAREGLETRDVLAPLFADGGKDAGLGGITGEESRHVIGRAAHQPETRLGPSLDHLAAQNEVARVVRNLPAAMDRLAGHRRWESHRLARFRRRCDVVKPRNRAHGTAEGGMGGYVSNDLAIDKNASAIAAISATY